MTTTTTTNPHHPPRIGIIGGGAAGILAARHLLQRGLCITILESRMFPGGAWCSATPSSASGGSNIQHACSTVVVSDNNNIRRPQMWDTLTPNLSKFTCCFSEHPWPSTTPTFPSLVDMQQYLNANSNYLVVQQNEKCTIHYGCTVTHVARSSTSSDDDEWYKVEWEQQENEKGSVLHFSKEFDKVIVATGFFSTPVYPDGLMMPILSENGHSILHSSQFRSPEEFANLTVAVVGNSFSAHEIASTVRQCAKHVVSITGTRSVSPYILPRYVNMMDAESSSSGSGAFVPLDYVLYRRTEDAPKIPEQIAMDDPACLLQRHKLLSNLLGSRKRAQLAAKGIHLFDAASFVDELPPPPRVSISDDYVNLVIDGKIQVVQGRLARVIPVSSTSSDAGTTSKATTFNIELEDGGTVLVPPVDRIIFCTGYRSQLDFLAPDIRETLQYDETDSFAPLTLCYDAFHPQLPGLGFVGMYKGSYFGYMELQARLLAGLFSGKVVLSEQDVSDALQTSIAIRSCRQSRRAQFPHFDYIGMMDVLADKLDLVPDPSSFGRRGMMVAPAFYQTNPDIARQCQEELEAEVRNQGSKIPKAVLSALVGKWSFERTITDNLSASTSQQRVHGQICYSLQKPKFETLRYREDGFLDLPNGNKLEVFREYDYLQKDGALEMYFIENGERAHLFLSLKFEEQQDGYWVAASDHLCIKDLYKGTFKIAFDGVGAREVIMTYRVNGPNKDYESVTHLRPLPE